MATPSANPTPVTPPRVPLIDQRTGLIDRAWYMFFFNLFLAAQSTEEFQTAPNAGSLLATYDAALRSLEQTTQSQPTILAVVSELSELAKQVQALLAAPTVTPQLRQQRYGSFYDTTTQTAAAINTAYAMTYNTTDMSVGVYLGSPTSRVYVDRGSVYNIQFSAQLDNTSGGNHLVYIWLRVNGADVANSASQVRLKGTDGELVAAWNFLYNFKAGDYFELMWSVSDTAVQIVAQAAAAPVPAIPSVILTVTDNISPNQN